MINGYRKINKAAILVMTFILVICLSITLQFTGTDRNQNSIYAEEAKVDVPKVPAFPDLPDFEERLPLYQELKGINDHTVGWIYIEGTKVDNILMQNKEEKDFYIDKDFNKEYYYPGTLYISDISDIIKPTDVVIMYGHNMKNGTMFGTLKKFEDPKFLEKYDNIIIDSMEGRLEYEITHVMRIRVNVDGGDEFPYYTYSDFGSEEDYDAFIEQCNNHVLYDSGKTTEFGDRFVMLTTCEYTYDDGTGRLVIMGKNPAPPEPEPAPTPEAVTVPSAETPTSGIDLQDLLIIGGIVLLVAIILLLLYKLRKNQNKKK